MRMQPWSLITLLTALTLVGCGRSSSGGDSTNGTATGNPAGGGATTPGTESLLLTSDASAAAQTVAAQVDSGISAAATENDASASTALMLTDADKSAQNNRYRSCSVSGKNAVVTIDQDIERDYTFTGPKRTLTNDFSSYYVETRTWGNASGTAIGCSANGKYAAVTVPNLAGMTLSDTVQEERQRQITLDNTRSGVSTTSTTKFSLNGTRTVDWQTVTLTGGQYLIQKTASHSMMQTIQVTKKDGTSVSLSSSNDTGTGAPLQIQVVRDQTTLAILKRTIQSGEIDSLFRDGTTLSSVYSNVEYDASSSTPCVAVSGSITGTLLPAGGTPTTYTITFGDTPTIAFAGGLTADYVQDGCALDEASVTPVDATAASAVTAPSGIAPVTPADGLVTANASGT